MTTVPPQRPRPVFITGTYRCGGNFLAERASADRRVLIPSDLMHFFRFSADKELLPTTAHAVQKHLDAFVQRIQARCGVDLSPFRDLVAPTPGDARALYDALRVLLTTADGGGPHEVFGEKTAQDWRRIPDFLDLFPEGRAVHVLRDPRAVVASWRRVTIQPQPLYLDAIFKMPQR